MDIYCSSFLTITGIKTDQKQCRGDKVLFGLQVLAHHGGKSREKPKTGTEEELMEKQGLLAFLQTFL